MPDNGGGAAKPIRRRSLWRALVRHVALADLLLGDDAGAIVAALKAAI